MLPQHLEKFQPEILVLEMGADSLAIQKEPQSCFLPGWNGNLLKMFTKNRLKKRNAN